MRLSLSCVSLPPWALRPANDLSINYIFAQFTRGFRLRATVIEALARTMGKSLLRRTITVVERWSVGHRQLLSSLNNPAIVDFGESDRTIVIFDFGSRQQQDHDIISQIFLRPGNQFLADSPALVL